VKIQYNITPTSGVPVSALGELTAKGITADHDEYQINLMKENVIVTDVNDNIIGHATKQFSHLLENIKGGEGMLHRAFSVFLFNERQELLLQQRSHTKVTFPLLWTNTCCSHPIYIPEEMDGAAGAKRAAMRKLEHELGITVGALSPEAFNYITRIHYCAASGDVWGEHEIDYIMLAECDSKTMPLKPNAEEVDAVKWVTKEQLQQMFDDEKRNKTTTMTPWFRLICDSFTFKWWDYLLAHKSLKGVEKFNDHHTIHRLK